MGEITNISWCKHTFNPWIGCTKVTPACDGCYAEHLMDHRLHRVKWGPHGDLVRTTDGYWRQPKVWNGWARDAGKRELVFCASLADVFDNQAPQEWRADLFEVIRATPHLVWLLLTKRPQNIIKLVQAIDDWPFPANAALGATIEDQIRANINVPHLLRAKVHLQPRFAFVSCEPLLGYIELEKHGWLSGSEPTIDWVITGGETDQGKHKARPSHPDWFRDLRDQCARARARGAAVAFHHKQNGEWVSVSEAEGAGDHYSFDDGAMVRKVGKVKSGRTIDGIIHDEFPQL